MIDRDRSQSLQFPPKTPQLTRHKIKRFIRRAKRRRETLLPLHLLKSDVASYRRLAHWGGTSHKPDRPVSFWLMRPAVANDNRKRTLMGNSDHMMKNGRWGYDRGRVRRILIESTDPGIHLVAPLKSDW